MSDERKFERERDRALRRKAAVKRREQKRENRETEDARFGWMSIRQIGRKKPK